MGDTELLVHLDRLEKNAARLRGLHPHGSVYLVIKANAYGHGMVPVARFLTACGDARFAVARLEEALELRRAGVPGRVLVLGPVSPEDADAYARHEVEATVPSLEHLQALAVRSPRGPLSVHLKVDTGMGRIGWTNPPEAALGPLLRGAPSLRVVGVYSHLAEAEVLGSGFAACQLERLRAWFATFLELKVPGERPELHLANSAGLLRDEALRLDAARVGYALWAPPPFTPAEQAPEAARAVEPVAELRTRIAQVKTMRGGETVGYGRTYTARAGETIATLPVGYGDGYLRAFSNRAQVLYKGARYPVAGSVSMDQITVSLGEQRARVGEAVHLLGGGPGGVTPEEAGAWAGTIGYEVMTTLNRRVRREYRYGGRAVTP